MQRLSFAFGFALLIRVSSRNSRPKGFALSFVTFVVKGFGFAVACGLWPNSRLSPIA